MAANLNKSRILYSKCFIAAAIAATLFLETGLPLEGLLKNIGYILVGVCALGRLYTTVFIGGQKNETLTTYGPYSIVRHPLYSFSLIGIAGVSLMTGNIFVIILLPLSFLLMYQSLMQREEEFLSQKFGASYAEYMQKTRRLTPKFSQYYAPEIITARPAFIKNAFLDAIWWFSALPILEFVDYIRRFFIG